MSFKIYENVNIVDAILVFNVRVLLELQYASKLELES